MYLLTVGGFRCHILVADCEIERLLDPVIVIDCDCDLDGENVSDTVMLRDGLTEREFVLVRDRELVRERLCDLDGENVCVTVMLCDGLTEREFVLVRERLCVRVDVIHWLFDGVADQV